MKLYIAAVQQPVVWVQISQWRCVCVLVWTLGFAYYLTQQSKE